MQKVLDETEGGAQELSSQRLMCARQVAVAAHVATVFLECSQEMRKEFLGGKR